MAQLYVDLLLIPTLIEKVTDSVHRTTAIEREEQDLSKVPRFLYNSAMIYWDPTILRVGTISTHQRRNASEADRWCKENTPNSYVFLENTRVELIPSDDLKRAEQNDSLKSIKIYCRAGSCLSLKVWFDVCSPSNLLALSYLFLGQ